MEYVFAAAGASQPDNRTAGSHEVQQMEYTTDHRWALVQGCAGHTVGALYALWRAQNDVPEALLVAQALSAQKAAQKA